MHNNNIKWITDLKSKYSPYRESFINKRILELGSGSVKIGGTIRPFFENPVEYVGVDILGGDGVDVICAAKDTRFTKNQFDTIAIFSLFEHDTTWKESLSHNLQWLKPGGVVFVCFGAEGNIPHMDVWKLVPHQEFLDFCKTLPVKILDSFFEEDVYGPDCMGAYDVLLQKI